MYQRKQMMNMCMNNKVEAYDFAYEIKIDKKMNWCMFAK